MERGITHIGGLTYVSGTSRIIHATGFIETVLPPTPVYFDPLAFDIVDGQHVWFVRDASRPNWASRVGATAPAHTWWNPPRHVMR